MSLNGLVGDVMSNAAGNAGMITALAQARANQVDAQEAIQEWKQYSADLQAQILALQQRLASSEAEKSDLAQQLEAKDQEAQRLAAQVEAQNNLEKNHLDYMRLLKKRLTQTEKALRHSSAMSTALEHVHKLLIDEVKRVSSTDNFELLQGGRHRQELETAWKSFMESGRLAIRPEQNEELRTLGADIPPEREESRAAPAAR